MGTTLWMVYVLWLCFWVFEMFFYRTVGAKYYFFEFSFIFFNNLLFFDENFERFCLLFECQEQILSQRAKFSKIPEKINENSKK